MLQTLLLCHFLPICPNEARTYPGGQGWCLHVRGVIHVVYKEFLEMIRVGWTLSCVYFVFIVKKQTLNALCSFIVAEYNHSVKSGFSISLGFVMGCGIVQISPCDFILQQRTQMHPIIVQHINYSQR